MKSLSREAIQRMTGGASGASGSGSAGGGTVDLTGYATEIWTEEHYINKEFFSSLFKAYDANGNEVLPNDTETVVSSIKAMFGFWTEFYLSALGTGGQGSVGIRLSQLADVDVTGVADGQALIYNSNLGKWVPGSPTHGTVTSVGMSVPTGLKVNPASITSSGTFSIAFDTGYSIPLTTDVNKGITAYGWGNHAVQGYATQTWVGQNYLGINATAVAASKLATARSLWGQSFDGTANVSGSLTDVGSITPNGTADLGNNTKPFRYLYASWVGSQSNVDMQFGANNGNHAIIKTNGNVGIGTTSPSYKLHVAGTFYADNLVIKANSYLGDGKYGMNCNNSDIIGANSIYTADLSDSWSEGIEFKRTNDNWDSFRAADGVFYFGANSGTEKDGADIGSAAANLRALYANNIYPGNNNNLWLRVNNTSTDKTHIICDGPVIIPVNTDVAADSYGRYALAVGGDPRNDQGHIAIDNNEIMAKASASTSGQLWINAQGGNVSINTDAGNCGIGTGSPSYKLHVAGVIYSSTGVYSAGYVTALSDIRKKDVVKNFILKAEDIAAASLIKFTWKDKHDTDLHAGGIAQEWQKILPEAVHKTADDELSMDYSVIALSSAVSLAREVVSLKKTISDLEARIRRFERMFAINENDIED